MGGFKHNKSFVAETNQKDETDKIIDFKGIANGKQINILFDHLGEEPQYDSHLIEEIEGLLLESEEKFLENKNRKWILPVFGFIFSGVLTYYVAYGLYNLENSIYDRIRFDGLLETQFGDFGVRDALTEDIFLISYSYNFGIPRFYTKNYAINPSKQMDYDVKMNFAAAATSATPFIFDPVTRYTFNNKQR